MTTKKLKEIRESMGFLPDQDLYDFAEAVVDCISKEMASSDIPLSYEQVAIARSFFQNGLDRK